MQPAALPRLAMAVALVIASASAAIAADERAALDDDPFLMLRELSSIRGCASNCSRTAVTLLKVKRYQCSSARAGNDFVCVEPKRRWQVLIDKRQFKNGMDRSLLLRAALTLSNAEPRSVEALTKAYFPDWHLGTLALPEHGPVEDSIYHRSDKVDVSMVFGMTRPMTGPVIDSVIIAITSRDP